MNCKVTIGLGANWRPCEQSVIPAARLGAHIWDTASATRRWTRRWDGSRSFPRRVADLTPEALSRGDGSHRRVGDGARRRGGHVVAGPARADGTDVPESVFVKLLRRDGRHPDARRTGPARRDRGAVLRAVGAALGDGIPTSYGAAFDALTGRYVVVLEDMTTTPCQFADTLHPLSIDQMAQLGGGARRRCTARSGASCPRSPAGEANSVG